MLRLVLDTDVMFAAFHSPAGASRRLFLEILDGKALYQRRVNHSIKSI